MQPGTTRAWPRLAVAVCILLLAVAFRWLKIGEEPFSTDEASLSVKAINVARHGALELRGPPMSVGLFHSPLTVWLYALPYRLSPDPRVARMFTGAMNVIAVALVYLIGRRYFGARAAVIAALLFAVTPDAVMIGRTILNTTLGPPFVMGYVLTGLLGYCDDRKWARIAHLPLLALAAQCHPATFLLAPITAVLGLYALRHRPARRWPRVRQTLVGGLLALALLLPWGARLYLDLQQRGEGAVTMLRNRGLGYTFSTMYVLLGNWEQNFTQPIQPAITAIGSIWLIALALRRREYLSGAIAVMGFLLVPGLSLALDLKYRDSYIWPDYGNAFLIQGALLGGYGLKETITRSRPARAGGLRALVAAISIAAAGILFLNHLRFFVTFDRSGGAITLDAHTRAIQYAEALADSTGRDLILLTPYGDETPYDYLQWEILRESTNGRVVWHDRGLPLPAGGAVLLGPADYEGRPFVFSGGQIVERGFRLAELPPADRFAPDIRPPLPVRLANGATAIGFLRETPGSLPSAGGAWTIFMIWRAEAAAKGEYKAFVHLVDETGGKHAQLDLPALPAGQWRAGEYVMNQFDLKVGRGLPETGPLYLRFGMYDSTGNVPVLDASGKSDGQYGLIQIRGQPQPLVDLAGGIALEQLDVTSPIPQGRPLDVEATWRITQTPGDDVRLRWLLLDASGQAAWEGVTPLIPGANATAFLPGLFASQPYNLRIPTTFAAGTYALELRLLDSQNAPVGEPYRYPTPVEITPRDRRFDLPPMQHAVGATFGDEIELGGYDLRQAGPALSLTLYWRALTQIERDYKYFVHVWKGGQVVAQVDSMPALYQYRTSWWAENEIVTEPLSLDLGSLGPGTYTVTTGFYDPEGGRRLPVTLADGTLRADAWAILQDVIVP